MPSEPAARGSDEPAPFTSLPGWQARSHLPQPLSALIGRDDDIAATAALVRDPATRLVTLTGPGGVGKTRLALAVAAEVVDAFPEGVVFVDLGDVLDPALVAPTIAHALGISRSDSRPALTILMGVLASARLLLVLDNFEQVIDATTTVRDLLEACPRVSAMVTSRALLSVSGERVIQVPSLSLPNSDGKPDDADAVRLFVERSQAIQPAFALSESNTRAVAAICARLDGLPLAIELAAARTVLFPPDALLARLDRRLAVLAGGGRDLPDRQRTMRDTIAWSFDLLDPNEQVVLRRMAVFVGGCTLAAAEAVCAGPDDQDIDVLATMESLIRQSLVQVGKTPRAGGQPRLTMLATVREFTAEALAASGDEQPTMERHARYYLDLASSAEPAFWGDAPAENLGAAIAERGNLRAALIWAIDRGTTDMSLQLATATFDPSLMLDSHHFVRTDSQDQLTLVRRALAMPGGNPRHRVAALVRAAWLVQAEGDLDEGRELAATALQVAGAHGDALGEATAAFVMGRAEFRAGSLDAARHLLEDAIARFQPLGTEGRAAWARCVLASIDTREAIDTSNDAALLARAAALCDEALAVFEATGHQPGISRAMHGRATVAAYQHDYPRALVLLHDLLLNAWERGLALRHFLEEIAHIAGRMDRPDLAVRLYGAAEAERQHYGAEVLPVRVPELEFGMAPTQAALGEAGFAAGIAIGQTASLELVVAEALHFAEVGSAPAGIELTRREREILPMLARGMTAREMGEELFLSHRTIEHHIARLAAKLEVHTRAEILEVARESSLLDIPE